MRGRGWAAVTTIIVLFAGDVVVIEGSDGADASVQPSGERRRCRDARGTRPPRLRADRVSWPMHRFRRSVRRPDVRASDRDVLLRRGELLDRGRRAGPLLEVRQSSRCRRVPRDVRHRRQLRGRLHEAVGLSVGDDLQHHGGEEAAPRRESVLLPQRRRRTSVSRRYSRGGVDRRAARDRGRGVERHRSRTRAPFLRARLRTAHQARPFGDSGASDRGAHSGHRARHCSASFPRLRRVDATS